MIPSDELRAAAKRLRSLAGDVCFGNVEALSRTWVAEPSGPPSVSYDVVSWSKEGTVGTVVVDLLGRYRAEFIAAMDPAVALAIADLLDVMAELLFDDYRQTALALAGAVNGKPT
jgi:hypothetical protein